MHYPLVLTSTNTNTTVRTRNRCSEDTSVSNAHDAWLVCIDSLVVLCACRHGARGPAAADRYAQEHAGDARQHQGALLLLRQRQRRRARREARRLHQTTCTLHLQYVYTYSLLTSNCSCSVHVQYSRITTCTSCHSFTYSHEHAITDHRSMIMSSVSRLYTFICLTSIS